MKSKLTLRAVVLELSKYGMLLITLLLCVLFSFWTRPEIHPEGTKAGEALAKAILRSRPSGVRVAIIAPKREADLVAALTSSLESGGAQIVAASQGNKTTGLKLLQELSGKQQQVDVIACTRLTSAWMYETDSQGNKTSPIAVLNELERPRVMTPPPGYGWPTFLTKGNAINIATIVSVIGIIAIGMTFVIITGGIDLSVGSLVALASVIGTLLIRDGISFARIGIPLHIFGGRLEATTATMVLSSLIAILVCGLFGLTTGLLVTKFRLPAFIVTLSFMLIARGIAKYLTKSESVYQIPPSFDWLGGQSSIWTLPNAVVLMFALYAAAYVLMHYSVLGRYLYAVGGNMEAARLSGVPVVKVVLFAYVMCGLLAGVGGIVEASRAKSGSATFGDMYELSAIAAVVVGGTSIAGGEGKILGTLVGAFMIAIIGSGMNQSDVPHEVQPIVLGSVILGAVLLDKLKQWLVRITATGSD